MKINRNEILKTLVVLQEGLSQKDINQFSSIVFKKNYAFSYNDEVAVSHPIKTDIVGAVPGKELYQLISKVSSEEVELTIKDNELFVKGSRAKAGLRLEAEILIPLDELGTPDKWVGLPENFCEAVSFCMPTCCRDLTFPALVCVHITSEYAESCDNYRVSRFEFVEASKAFKKPILVPARNLKSILNIEPVEFASTDGWVHFKNEDNVVVSSRVYQDEFPDVEGFLKVKGKKTNLPKKLNEVLDRANVLSDGERITIDIGGDSLTVKAQGKAGWFEEKVKTIEGVDCEFDITPEFLKSVLKLDAEMIVGKTMLAFKGENFIHSVLLLSQE